jgi:Eco29kI-like restriction endonuclease
MAPYNPLDKVQLAKSIREALEAEPVHDVPPERFLGAGVYALYYHGNFELYAPISDEACEVPIYVGRAVSTKSRRGLATRDADEVRKPALYGRLRKHSRSIDNAENLDAKDFSCRYLILDDVWVPLGESYMIDLYKPLWNGEVGEGFGINAPGAGRAGQKRSVWDTLHPGRDYAAERPAGKWTAEEVTERVRAHFAGQATVIEPEDEDDEAEAEEAEPRSAATPRATASASRTGTALPICRMARVRLPATK